ncbi:unnamed protein product [Brassica oleracea var. botrytis]
MGEDEDDDGDYDYNYWHEYCRNDCVTDEEDDFEGSPPKRRGGGQTGSNCNRRSRPMSGRGQGSGKPASGRGQRTSATGVSKATKKACIRRRSEVNTDEVRDIYALLEQLGLRTPKKHIPKKAGDTGKSVDVVLVTPPKQYNKHIRVSEDNDEAVDPPITQCTDDDFVESVRSGDTGQSVDVVLGTRRLHSRNQCPDLNYELNSQYSASRKRLCDTCKCMRVLADDGGVYAAFDLFKYPWYVGMRNLLLRRCFEEGNPSTLFVKGV